MASKEKIMLSAMDLPEYEQKQIAAVLIINTLNPMAIDEVVVIARQLAVNKAQEA